MSDKSVIRAPRTTKNFYGQLTNRCVVARGQPNAYLDMYKVSLAVPIEATVVPPIYDLSDQQLPLVYDRFCYGRTKFVLQLPLVSDYLSNATSDH